MWAKSTILKMQVSIRKFKYHQKIPWLRFAGNDIKKPFIKTSKNTLFRHIQPDC
jgi:hypothetical protein